MKKKLMILSLAAVCCSVYCEYVFASGPMNVDKLSSDFDVWETQKMNQARPFLSNEQIQAIPSSHDRPFGMQGLSCYIEGAKCQVFDGNGNTIMNVPFRPLVLRTFGEVRIAGKKWDEPLEVRGELVFIGYGLEANEPNEPNNIPWSSYGATSISGKIAVLVRGAPAGFEKSLGKQITDNLINTIVTKHGASAVIAIGPEEFPSGVCSDDGILTIFIGESWGRKILAQSGINLDEFRKQTTSPAKVAGPQMLALSAHISIAGVEYQQRECKYFFIRYRPDTNVGRTLEDLIARREAAISRLTTLFDVNTNNYQYKPIFIIYPNAEEKAFLSRHIGAGYAMNGVIGEDHGERPEERIDDYHEFTHMIASLTGSPTAIFKEGLATVMGETQAQLEPIKNGTLLEVDIESARNYRKGTLWPLKELIKFDDIGPGQTKPMVAYPQSASIVAYIIRNYGWDKLMELYQQIKDTSTAVKVFEQIMGISISDFESKWLTYLQTIQEEQSKLAKPAAKDSNQTNQMKIERVENEK